MTKIVLFLIILAATLAMSIGLSFLAVSYATRSIVTKEEVIGFGSVKGVRKVYFGDRLDIKRATSEKCQLEFGEIIKIKTSRFVAPPLSWFDEEFYELICERVVK